MRPSTLLFATRSKRDLSSAHVTFLLSVLVVASALVLIALGNDWQSPVPSVPHLPMWIGFTILTGWTLLLLDQRRSLIHTEQRAATAFEQEMAGIGVIDAEARWVEVNARLAEITGYARDELIGTPLCELLFPEDREQFRSRMQAFLADRDGPVTYSVESRWRHKDGSPVWLSRHIRRIPNHRGTVGRAMIMAFDVTARRVAEASVETQREQERFQFDHLPVPMIEWGPGMTVKRWSDQAERTLGWTKADVEGRTLRQVGMLCGLEADSHESAMARIERGELDRVESPRRCIRKDGSNALIRWTSSVMRNADGTVKYFFTAGLDLTEVLSAHESVRVHEAQLQAIFEQASIGVALLDADGRWLEVNDRVCEITGYTRDAILQTDYQSITHPDDLAQDVQLAQDVNDGRRRRYSMDKRYVRADGSTVWVRLNVGRIEGDGPARYISMIEDISAERENAENLRQLHADLERKVFERTRQLQGTTHRWSQRTRELKILTEMTSAMSAAHECSEASRIIASFVPKIFSSFDGEIWLQLQSQGRMFRVASWGTASDSPSEIDVHDCWALRRGYALLVDEPTDPLICRHYPSIQGYQKPHACCPITANGEMVGLIHVRWDSIDEMIPDRTLLRSTGEQIGLVIGNLRLRSELHRQATRDPLTGLHNRRSCEDALTRRMAAAESGQTAFGLLLLDLDHFKSINDTHGHHVGDEVLRGVGHVLGEHLRLGDEAFRLGGEEFVVLLGTTTRTALAEAGERVRKAIEAMAVPVFGGGVLRATASIGAVLYPEDAADRFNLMQRADDAMYNAKRTGRNRVCMVSVVADSKVELGAVQPDRKAH